MISSSSAFQLEYHTGPPSDQAAVEVSVVMPCLNEEETLGICLEKAQRAMKEAGIAGEIVVADNGSSDRSVEIAQQFGARVIHVEQRGYGNALMGGIEAALGRYVIMGDADDSYDFLEIPNFVEKLRAGADLVQGCRLPSGGGTIQEGAMPFLHRWLGNPLFSRMTRSMFRAPIHDVYCGLRGFTKALYLELDLRCTGMEFATEMIIKSSLFSKRIEEIPITLHVDGRQTATPHLRTFRDGWRTLRFFLMYSPKWLFFIPGMMAILLGMIGYALAWPGVELFGARLDAHSLLFASLAMLIGYQSVWFSIFSTTFAVSEGLMPVQPHLSRFHQKLTLERGILIGLATLLCGTLFLGSAINQWRLASFGDLVYAETMRFVIPGVTLCCLGLQTVLGSFLSSILRLARR